MEGFSLLVLSLSLWRTATYRTGLFLTYVSLSRTMFLARHFDPVLTLASPKRGIDRARRRRWLPILFWWIPRYIFFFNRHLSPRNDSGSVYDDKPLENEREHRLLKYIYIIYTLIDKLDRYPLNPSLNQSFFSRKIIVMLSRLLYTCFTRR